MVKAMYSDAEFSYCVSVDHPPFVEQSVHAHDICELFLLTRGEGYYVTEGSIYPFEPGTLILMRPGEMHHPVCFGNEPYERMSLHFSPGIVKKIDPEMRLLRMFFNRPLGKNNVYNKNILSATNVYALFEKMEQLASDTYVQRVQILSYLYPVLLELGDIFDNRIMPDAETSGSLVHEIVEYINRNLAKELSVDQICQRFYLSRTQLYRSFKKATGTNVGQYINLKRIVRAHSYIEEGVSPNEAASLCGFRDYSAFYRAYIKKYGESPTGQHRK